MVENLPTNAGDVGSIPGSGRSPGVRNGNLLQYPCLENPWREEPGRLQFLGSKRVGDYWATIRTQKQKVGIGRGGNGKSFSFVR